MSFGTKDFNGEHQSLRPIRPSGVSGDSASKFAGRVAENSLTEDFRVSNTANHRKNDSFNQTKNDSFSASNLSVEAKDTYSLKNSARRRSATDEGLVSKTFFRFKSAVSKFEGKTTNKTDFPNRLRAKNTMQPSQTKTFLRFLDDEKWLLRGGHALTFAFLFLFTAVLYFRPYEMFSFLSPLSQLALYLALATIAAFFPAQLAAEGNFSALPREMKLVLGIVFFALMTMPLARDTGIAWKTFSDIFIKAILMFIVIINAVRTEKRFKLMIGLALAVGAYLSWDVLGKYMRGEFAVEGYRVQADVKGMFGNPNDLAIHLVIVTPLAVAFAMSAKNFFAKISFWLLTALLIGANMVTFSRGGFLGLILSAIVMAWKFGRESRVKIFTIGTVLTAIFMAVAPGGYGVRLLSIFIPGLDPVGSSDQRKELLIKSIIVTLRNPWGIGMNNFTIMSDSQHVTHNSYTQVSSELGVLALAVYLLLLITPLRRLNLLEKEILANDERQNWIYYFAVGLQASLVGFMASSFFGAVAYQWGIYYLIGYMVCLRRIYQTERSQRENFPITPATGEMLPAV